jgi:hypothetical protein
VNETSGFESPEGGDDGVPGQTGAGLSAYAVFELGQADGVMGFVPAQGSPGDEVQEPPLG